jgi:hypothetical protein
MAEKRNETVDGEQQRPHACDGRVTSKSHSFYTFSTGSSQLACRCLERAVNAAETKPKLIQYKLNYETNS